MKKIITLVLAIVLVLSCTALAEWPEKDILLIQPWSLGGGPDVITRKICEYSTEYFGGHTMYVENHNGASGTIGMNDFLEAEDDGYTIFCCNGPLFSLTPSFIPVDYTIDDISPLVGIRITEFVILTNADSGITNLEELVAYANEGHVITYATTGGPGNDSYTMISALFAMLDIPCEAVPYDGGQEAINALVGGHVDVAAGSPPVYREYVINGDLNCLGTFIPEGLDVEGIGHIDSFKSQGYDIEFTGMDYLACRSTVDPEIQAKLREYVLYVYSQPDFQEFMAGMGMAAWDADAETILAMIDAQTEAMAAYIPLVG